MFADSVGFTLASLSSEGAVFSNGSYNPNKDLLNPNNKHNSLLTSSVGVAGQRSSANTNDDGDGDDETTPGSTVYYHAFPGSVKLDGCNENFTVDLPVGEIAVSVCVGTGWIAVASNRQWLRVFSSTGLQLGIFWCAGTVVTLCGHEDQLAVIFNSSPALGYEYKLHMQLYKIQLLSSGVTQIMTQYNQVFVPLSPHSTLTWASFTVDSLNPNLSIIDSKGVVSVLLLSEHNTLWMPVLEIEKIRKSIDHKYWPIMIRGNKFVFVLLNGESKPLIYPQPVVTARALRLPIIELREGVAMTGVKEKDRESLHENHHKLIYDTFVLNHLQNKNHDILQKLQLVTNTNGSNNVTTTSAAMTNVLLHDFQSIETKYLSQSEVLDRSILEMYQLECRHVNRTAQVHY